MAFENLYLPENSVIGEGRYLIGKVLNANGDGVTYLAFDTEKKTTVEVREFLPDSICIRKEDSTHLLIKNDQKLFYDSCLASFLDMWRKLARMRGLSALILVIDIIEENNTAYAICEHMEGALTLHDYLLKAGEGYISWEAARILFMPVLSTLSTLHGAGIIHRGISPDTLYVGTDNKIRIGGFCIPECRNKNTGIKAEIFEGYAPVEQFGMNLPSGPWTDIYAFAAVLYRALIGITPIESTTRMQSDRMMIPAKFAETIPAYVINALINALQIMPEDRTKTVEILRDELSASPTAALAEEFEAEASAAALEENIQKETSHVVSKTPAEPKKSAAEIKKENTMMALKAGGIAAGVVILIFIILCCTVLKGHIGKNPGNKPGTGDQTSAVSPDTAIQVPTFTGRTYTSITSQKSYFKDFSIKTKEEYSTEVNRGYVISQSIEPGTEVNPGTEIELVISLGVEQAEMVDVIGKTYDEAVALLKEAGFENIKKIDMTNDGSHTSNTVASTIQKVGELYDKTEKITLTVYVEAETTTQPDG